jgi:phosphoribosylformylglycinamidine synthase
MTIHRSLNSLGLTEVTDVRQGKIFNVQLKDGLPPEQTREQVERLAKQVLTNPVIEEYRIIWE